MVKELYSTRVCAPSFPSPNDEENVFERRMKNILIVKERRLLED
ncbi:MAG: hypothetical protein ACXABO_19785 [Promethearchaeota archaeon]|jgi:hypothetical protein